VNQDRLQLAFILTLSNFLNMIQQRFPNCASRRPGEARNYDWGGGKNLDETDRKQLTFVDSLF
jgi:hypothetical protein